MKINTRILMHLLRARQNQIELFVFFKLIPRVLSYTMLGTRHFREWLRSPMNYVRIVELPLTFELLDASKSHHILDISSPKLLSLYMSIAGFKNLVVSDIENYFVEDFKVYSREFHISPRIQVFDALRLPYKDNTFDRVFSISVLEHLVGKGDIDAVREVGRVLKPGGIFVFTLPANSRKYMEEWLKKAPFYWKSIENREGLIFYQRRYDQTTIQERFGIRGLLDIEDILFIAERPIQEPQLNENGNLCHNLYYLDDRLLMRVIRKLPLLPYFGYRYASKRYHYLTRDGIDPNIRQVAVILRKKNPTT